jgi:ABC-type transporter Mla MlaB component
MAVATTAFDRTNAMLRITCNSAGEEIVLKLEGCLAGPWVPELARCWREAVARASGLRMRIDLSDVSHVDPAGQDLMTTMYRAGVRFVARGFVMPELVREISETVERGRS